MDKTRDLSNYITACDVKNIINLLKNYSHINGFKDNKNYDENLNIAVTKSDHIEGYSETNLNINHRDSCHGHQSPLMRLCHLSITPAQRLDILDLLLECGADTSIQDAQGRTVLHHVCIAGCAEVMETLGVAGGCQPGAEDGDGDTPLILAARCGEAALVEGLLESFGHMDLRPHHRNKHGLTALAEAQRRKDQSVCDVISSFFNMSSSENDTDQPTRTPNSRVKQPVYNPKHANKSDLKQEMQNSTHAQNKDIKPVSTVRVTRRQLRKKQSERLAPVIVSNHTSPAPSGHANTRSRPKKQQPTSIPNHVSMLPKRNEQIHKQTRNSSKSKSKCSTKDFKSMDEIEREYFEDFDDSESVSDAGYSDDDFCADDEGEDPQFCEQTVTELNFNLAVRNEDLERTGSFSLPDLRGKSSSLVGSSNPSSSASVRSEGAAVRQPVTLQERYTGDVPKQELSLPQLAEMSHDSSTDETSTDDSYKEPLTPRSKAGRRNSMSLPELPSHRALIPQIAMASLITPRGVDLVFATDSDSSAPSTYRGAYNHDTSLHDSLPKISSRSMKSIVTPRGLTADTNGTLVGTPRGGGVTRVEQPDSWLYNKSQRKAGLRLVGANYNS